MVISTLFRGAAKAAPLLCRGVASTRLASRSSAACALLRPVVSALFSSSTAAAFATKISSDTDLLRVIDEEIKCARECDDHESKQELPQGFLFEMIDNKGMNIVTLKRSFQDENIEVIVSMPSIVTGDEPDHDNRTSGKDADDDEDDDQEEAEVPRQSSIPLTVNVSKKVGGPTLEFSCTAYPDDFVIDAMSVRVNSKTGEEEMIPYEGPDFNDLDENLQKAFHKYLEIRGITPHATNCLHLYMINKDSREYLHWLENLKDFIQK